MAQHDETTVERSTVVETTTITGTDVSSQPGQTTRTMSAEKRAAIGLDPSRPTARAEVQRPPDDDIPQWRLRWLALLLSALALATLLLLLGRMLDWPLSWAEIQADLNDTWGGGGASSAFVTYDLEDEGVYRRLIEVDFTAAAAGLDEESMPNQYQIWTDRDAGVYRMRIWPDNMTWSVLGKACLGPYRVETSTAIAGESPTAYTGLLGRFQNTRSFYMFVVDGSGSYRVVLQLDGEWVTLQPWTESPALNPAGQANKLSLMDDGRTLNFFSNDELLYGVSDLALPAGNTGLVGGARDEIAELVYDWVNLYDLPCRVQ